MKKNILVLALGLVMAIPAFADHYGMAGCGLGSLVLKENNMVSQIFASTTNGTSGSQTFGITSGTSNCMDNGVVADAKKVPLFIEANQVALANDIARGNGEALASLSQMMGCQDMHAVGAVLQGNYKNIYSSDNIKNESVTSSIISTMKNNAALSQTCNFVI